MLSELRPDDKRAELLAELGMPFACFGRTRPGLPQPWADIDNAEAEAEAVRHVVERGYTWPCYIGDVAHTYWDTDREAGFRAGLARCGIPGDGAGVLRVGYDAGARAEIRSFLSSGRPDAVLTGSDKMAVIVYGVAAELNLRVGRKRPWFCNPEKPAARTSPPTRPDAADEIRLAVASVIRTWIESSSFFLYGTAAAIMFPSVFFRLQCLRGRPWNDSPPTPSGSRPGRSGRRSRSLG